MQRVLSGVCILISDLSSGGAQKVASLLANTWAKEGRAVSVITMKPPEDDFFALSSQVNRITIGGVKPSSNLFFALISNIKRVWQIRKAIRLTRQQHIISFVTSTNILAVLATFGLGIQLIISERNDPARQSHGRVWDFLRKRLYRHASIVTANSRQAVESLKEYVPERKLAYVPNPVEIPVLIDNTERHQSVLHVGKLIHQKAHDVILEAWSIVQKEAQDWQLDLIGDGPLLNEMKEKCQAMNLQESVHWHGWLKEVDEYYKHSSIFILPSRFEGTPNALMEAMSFGMPCIISNQTGGALDFIAHEKTGLIVPAEDAAALAASILRLMHDSGLRETLGHNARERMTQCEISQVMKEWEAVIGLPSSSNKVTSSEAA